MKLEITKYEPFIGNSKALKGKFNFKIKLYSESLKGDIALEIRDCSHWSGNKGDWINFPDKRVKNAETQKWEHLFSYVEIVPKDVVLDALLVMLKEYLAAQPAQDSQPAQECF